MSDKADSAMERIVAITVLEIFNAKARCWYTQEAAHRAWLEIAQWLTADEQRALATAWEHFRYHEGAEELDATCAAVKARLLGETP